MQTGLRAFLKKAACVAVESESLLSDVQNILYTLNIPEDFFITKKKLYMLTKK